MMSDFMLSKLDVIVSILKKNKASLADIETFVAYLQGHSYAEIARQQGLGRAATQARVSRLRDRTMDQITTFLDQSLHVRRACIHHASATDHQLARLLQLYHYDADFRPIVVGQFVLYHRQFRHNKKTELLLQRVVFSFLRMSKIRSLAYVIHEKEMANVIRARFPVAATPENDALLAQLFYAIASQKYACVLFSFQHKYCLSAPIAPTILQDMFLLGEAFKISTLFKQLGKLSDNRDGLFAQQAFFAAYLQAYVQQPSLCQHYMYEQEMLFTKKRQPFQDVLKQKYIPDLIQCMYANASEENYAIGSSPDIDFSALVQCVAVKSKRSETTVERHLRQSPLLLRLGYGSYASLRQEAVAYLK